jgi:DNA polymerase IV
VREIIHLDMDAFYSSVEALDNPTLQGKPVIVGGGERRGVVCAASYEARMFGVHSAQPTSTAKRLCPHGIFLPVRMERYQEMSDRIFGIFHRYTPLVEALSIDEAFLDVTASARLFGTSAEIAKEIKAAVRKETGLTVSAGVAATKFVSKIASDLRKPDGLTVVPRGKEKEFLSPLPVGKLWGVGKVTQAALHRMGVETIGDLSRIAVETLARKFGKHGVLLHELSLGIDDREVVPEREAKSIGREDTYPEDLVSMEGIRKELLSLATRVAERMRSHGVKGRTATLKVKYNDFTLITRAATLDPATDDGGEIYRCAVALLPKTEAGKRPIRLLGISLSNLSGGETEMPSGKSEQLPLFGKPPGSRESRTARQGFPPPGSREKQEKLHHAMDRIRQKFGKKGIRPAALLDEE